MPDPRQFAQQLLDENPDIFPNQTTLAKLLIAQKILEYHITCEREFQNKELNHKQ